MRRTICLVLCSILVLVMISGVALPAYEKTISHMKGLVVTVILGTIYDSTQLVDIDGQSFNVADTEKGRQLSAFKGKKVLVSGNVIEKEGNKQIIVLTYKLMPENPEY